MKRIYIIPLIAVLLLALCATARDHEVLVSRPEVIYRKDAKGNLLEPIEQLFLEIPKDAMGVVLENLASRKGEISAMSHHGDQVSIEALIPTRGLIGFETDLVNQTRGLGV